MPPQPAHVGSGVRAASRSTRLEVRLWIAAPSEPCRTRAIHAAAQAHPFVLAPPRAGAAGYLIGPWISRRRFPPDARNLPLVMWHEAGQFSKTWEVTLDGEWATRRSFCVVALPST